MLNNKVKHFLGASAVSAALVLGGCGGGEERQAEYLQRAENYYEQENYDKAKVEIKNVLQINPKHAQARYLLGMLAERDGELRAAFAHFNAALEVDPQHVKSLTKVGFYYFASKENDKALEKANAALAADANNADAIALLASIYGRQDKKELAIDKAQLALSIEPGHVQATTVLTAIYAKDNPDLALEVISEGIASQSKPESLKMLKIRLLYSQNKRDEVISQYQELISDHPDKLLYSSQLVNFYLADDRYSEEQRKVKAEKYLRELVAKKPDEEQVKLWLVEFLAKNRTPQDGVKVLEDFVSQEPDNYQLRDSLARLYVALKKNEAAKALYETVISGDPAGAESIRARNTLVSIYSLENNRPKVDELLEEIFSLDSENTEALITHAKIKLTESDLDSAIADLRVVLKNEPESTTALLLLATAHEKNKAVDLALDNYQRLATIDRKSLPALVGIGRILVKKNQLDDALEVLEIAKGLNNKHPETVRLLTELYSRNQRWDDALSASAQLVENQKTAALGHYLQGRTYLRKQDIKPAVVALEKSLELEPNGIETLSSLIGGYLALDQADKARRYVLSHLDKHSDQIHAQEILGGLYARSGELDKAIAIFNQVIEQAPGRNSAYQAKARILAAQGKVPEIEALFLSGLDYQSDNDGLRLMLAEYYQNTGRNDLAVNQYELLLLSNPDAILIKNNLAILLVDFFNTPENLNRANELATDLAATDSPAFLDTAGWIQYHLGNYPQAVSLLGAAVENGGKGAVYHYHLGMAYYKSDMKEQAKEQLQLALANEQARFPGKDEAINTLALL